jgi:hypothetical protein
LYNKLQPIKILEATYGPKNVLEEIKKMYKDGKRNFTANNTDFSDPAHGVVKDLIIKWEFDGKAEDKTVKEHSGNSIELPNGELAQGNEDPDYFEKACDQILDVINSDFLAK